MTGAGRLNRRVTIQYPETTVDTYGQPIVTWRDAYETWGRVETLSGREYFAAQGIQQRVEQRVTVRYSTVIEPTWRVEVDGKPFNIEHVINVGDSNAELQLMCSRVST